MEVRFLVCSLGHALIINSYYVCFLFSCAFGGNTVVLKVSQDEIKTCSTRDKCL